MTSAFSFGDHQHCGVVVYSFSIAKLNNLFVSLSDGHVLASTSYPVCVLNNNADCIAQNRGTLAELSKVTGNGGNSSA